MAVIGLLIGLLIADGALLRQAEAAFQRGREARGSFTDSRAAFQDAAQLYERLRAQGVHNARFYEAQGNTELLAGNMPRAILAYRRGLRLAPGDRELRRGLAHAREQVAYPSPGPFARPPAEDWPPWLPQPSPLALFGLVALFYMLACLAATRWWMVRRRALLGWGAVALLAAAAFAGLLVLEAQQRLFEERYPLVVIADDGVLLRRGNGLAYPPRSDVPLNRGVEARLHFTRGDWLQIELGSGEVGWVPAAYALVDR